MLKHYYIKFCDKILALLIDRQFCLISASIKNVAGSTTLISSDLTIFIEQKSSK